MPINRAKVQERAERLVRQGKIQSAVAEYRALLSDLPDDPNTLNRLGDLLVQIGRGREAVECFGQGAHLYTVDGFFLKAIALYKKILKIDPSQVAARLRLADLYARRDLISEARAEYIAVAERLIREDDEVRAREVYEKLIRMEPANVMARTALAEIFLGNGEVERALGEFRAAAKDLEGLGLARESVVVHDRIVTLAASDAIALAESVHALARLGEAESAVAAGRRLRARFPDLPAVTEALVEALEAAGHRDEAEGLVKSALSGGASKAVPRGILGRLHARAGRVKLALPLLLGAAANLHGERRFAEAAALLDEVLAFDPDHTKALALRLEAARELGDEGMVEKLSAICEPPPPAPVSIPRPLPAEPVRSAPIAAEAKRALTREERDFLSEHLTEAEVFIKYGLSDKAVEALNAILERFPDHLEAHVRLKGIFAERGYRSRVVDECLTIAEIHEREGQLEEASSVLVEARGLDPNHPVVQGRLSRLGSVAEGDRAAGGTAIPGEMGALVPSNQEAAPAGHGAHAAEAGREEGASDSGEFFDLVGEMGRSLAEVLQTEGTPPTPSAESQNLEEVFKAFQQKVEEEIGSEDYRTHYELAIAYKEMGLIDEAIAGLQHAARDPERYVDCCSLLGLCFREKGMPAMAEKWYLKGIQAAAGDSSRVLGLRFDLAETYFEMGDFGRAKAAFQQVAGVDRTYRGVAARLRDVEKLA